MNRHILSLLRAVCCLLACGVALFGLAVQSQQVGKAADKIHTISDSNAEPAYIPHPKGSLTYTHDIAPIMAAHCVSCHRQGEVGPFALAGYADLKKRAAQLVAVTERRLMPPWKANSHGEFQNENSLTPSEIGMIQQWAEEGAKEGDRADLSPAPHFTAGWTLGEPDAVLQYAKPYTLSAEGTDEYHTFILPTHFDSDRYVTAVEVRPGNRAVVHHSLIYIDTLGIARRQAAKGEMDYPHSARLGLPKDGILDIWAPGNYPHPLPEGVGLKLPKGADIVMEVHYHRSGKQETDQTRIGLYFCKGPVTQQLHLFSLAALRLQIPPGDAHYQTDAEITVPANATLLDIMPHMHLLGKSMRVNMTLPDGDVKTLVDVPDWDFNWQTTYWYREPVRVPRGAKIKLVATYDNSRDNPRNPNNPPKQVGWGEQTTDEMCLAFLGYTTDNEHITPITNQ